MWGLACRVEKLQELMVKELRLQRSRVVGFEVRGSGSRDAWRHV